MTSGTPVITYYVYDAAGQRVRKVTERQNGTRKSERLYLGGFELFREYDGSGTGVNLERQSLQVMDDSERVALVETRTQGSDDSPAQLIRFQFSNHLGSASLELDDAGDILSYEEYFPYGSTSYQAVHGRTAVPKRYRYTGVERDEETGLAYHGARYCIPWLGRWLNTDPAGLVDGANVYRYARNNPVAYTDPAGMDPVRPRGGPFATADHYKLPDVPGLTLPTVSDPNKQLVELSDEDNHNTQQIERGKVVNSPEYIDNALASVGVSKLDIWTLTFEELEYQFADKSMPSLRVSPDQIDLNAVGTADRYVKSGGLIFPLASNGSVALDEDNTPRMANGYRNKLVEADEQRKFRLLMATTVFQFQMDIASLGAAFGGMPEGNFSSIRLQPRLTLSTRAPGANAAGDVLADAESMAPLRAEAIGGERVWLVGPGGAGTTRAIRIVGQRITYDTAAPATSGMVKQDMGAMRNIMNRNGGPYLRGNWWSGTHGNPAGEFGGRLLEYRFIKVDRGVAPHQGWQALNVFRQTRSSVLGGTLQRPTAFSWCFSSAPLDGRTQILIGTR